MDASASSSNKKIDDDNKSNEPPNFLTQSIPSWPKYLMAKSTDENIQLTKLSPFKLADCINDIGKSKIVNATILNNYILLETNNEEQSKRLDTKHTCKVPVSITPHSTLILKKVSSSANNWISVLTKTLLQDYIHKYLYVYNQQTSTTRNCQNWFS